MGHQFCNIDLFILDYFYCPWKDAGSDKATEDLKIITCDVILVNFPSEINILPTRRDREGDHPARFGPGPLTALRGGGQAMIFIFSHPARLAPRLYKRHRHCEPRG